jgi:hypothetical protein
MTTDLYTKAVLTVIAVALSGIAIQLTTKEAHAQTQGLLFSPSGALMVSICDPIGIPVPGRPRSAWTCADVLSEGVTVAVRR